MRPAYLAGPDPDLLPFDWLASDCAWRSSDSRDLGSYLTWSPDHRFWLGEVRSGPEVWWRISAVREPLGPTAWMVSLSPQTPTEIVSDLMDKITYFTRSGSLWPGPVHAALRPPADRRYLLGVLGDANWRSVYRDGALEVESPDRLARVRVRVDPPGDPLDLDDPHIRIEVGPRGRGGQSPYWQARVSAGAPTVITDALADALTSTRSVTRERRWMDERLLADLEQLDPPAPEQPAQVSAPPAATTTTAQRVAAAASRTTRQILSTATADGTPPAADTAPLPAGRPVR
ncbi:DUF317 domain-containing protein [Kitasatospora phosalacinea]|uniref:DUF317 domain-containing protein n=1 Tax=Kitasatospora phosalacinea TaxID=2065 RepID=UPI000A925EB7|nr:DUF317 domain-containing protein [Kitasatospora phosalacinea]